MGGESIPCWKIFSLKTIGKCLLVRFYGLAFYFHGSSDLRELSHTFGTYYYLQALSLVCKGRSDEYITLKISFLTPLPTWYVIMIKFLLTLTPSVTDLVSSKSSSVYSYKVHEHKIATIMKSFPSNLKEFTTYFV